MSGKLLKSFFSSGLQAVSVQVLGVLFLGVVAYYLTEDEFGIISFSNAVAMFITTMLGFGLEQVVTRRIAASSSSDWAAAAFFFHALIASVVGLLLVFTCSYFLKDGDVAFVYLPYFFLAQCLLFVVVPLKQFLNAKHLFTPYGVIAIVSNVLKIAIALTLHWYGTLTLKSVAIILIFSASIELSGLIFYVSRKTELKFTFKGKAYKKLIKEAMPQYFSAIFDTSLSRLDWILLGVIASYASTGGYSFAYRAYELTRLPIVIIAPVLLNIFARQMVAGGKITEDKRQLVDRIFRVQVFLAMLIPLVFNIIWSPVLDDVFDGKYGSNNAWEFMILSFCIPLHFCINLLWTLTFSARRYKNITYVTVLTAVSNLALNLILIPAYGGKGAAISYLATTIIQGVLYYILVYKHVMKMPVAPLLVSIILGGVVYWGVQHLHWHYSLQLLVAIVAYLVIGFISGVVRKKHFQTLIYQLRK